MPTNLIEKARRLVEIRDKAVRGFPLEQDELNEWFDRRMDSTPLADAFLRAVELLRDEHSIWTDELGDEKDPCPVCDFLRDIGADE